MDGDAIDTRIVQEWALELGIDELGVCHAEPYHRAEAVIASRRARGLFADLKFTMARPEVSCHPQTRVGGAVSVISAALCYWQPDEALDDAGPATGVIGRYTRVDAYVSLGARLHEISRRLEQHGHRTRVLVDSNDHVDREAALRSGVGFAGKNTNVITRRFGSWVVLGTIVSDAALDATPTRRQGCGRCTACIDACPTGALVDVEGGELDATRCITYWTQSRHSIPDDVRWAMGTRVYGCDICQEVCPHNRGVEARRAGDQPWHPGIRLVDWLEGDDAHIDDEWQRLFVPRRQVRYLRRNALIALGNSGRVDEAALAVPYLDSSDELLRDHAAWALRRLGGPIAAAALRRAGA